MYPGQPGYGAPGYGAPGYGAPGYGAPGYGAPGVAPGYGAPGYGAPGYGTTTMITVPQAWNRVAYQYSAYYDPRIPFMPPIGMNPQDAQLMMTASGIFRSFDRNMSGTLDKKEWRRAMEALGYWMAKWDRKRLFMMVDSDRSGRINEREFCEYYLYAVRFGGFNPPAMGMMGAPPMGMAPMGMGAPMY